MNDLAEQIPRLQELANRLVAPGSKAEHVSCSETHEIREGLLALIEQYPIQHNATSDLPEALCSFGWSAAVLCYCESATDEEQWFVGSYSHHLNEWQMCGTHRARRVDRWQQLPEKA